MININILFLLLCCMSLCNAHERITLFQSDITIQSNAMIIVQETIEVVSEHKEILHGIVREFPTKYHDTLGACHASTCKLISITHNQQPTKYSIEQNYKCETIFIGDKNIVIPQGKHRYVITYEMNYRLSFFDTYDEFYWNVTGNRWRLPIEVAQAYIHLPDNDSKNLITTKIFTTYHGMHRNNDYSAVQDTTITIKPVYVLRPHESLTVLVKFPKGYFIESTSHQSMLQPLGIDTFSLAMILIFLCYFIMCIIFLMFAWLKNKPHNIMPTPYPPQNMTPSEIGFIMNRSFTHKLLIADIIAMVHLKFITITRTDNQYKIALQKTINVDANASCNPYYKKLLTTLFKKDTSILIAEKYIPRANNALKVCEDHAYKHNDLFYSLISPKTSISIMTALFILLIPYAFYIKNSGIPADSIMRVVPMMCLIAFLPWRFTSMFSLYTPQGKQKLHEVYAFKLYVMNRSRKNHYHTQDYPVKTIELYEKYLPYAIALGVEKQWARQFVHIGDTAENKGESSSMQLQFFSLYVLNDFITTFSKVATNKNSSGGDGWGDSGDGGDGGGGDGGW